MTIFSSTANLVKRGRYLEKDIEKLALSRHKMAFVAGPRQVVMLTVEQIVDAECRPEESDFSGFTWSPRTRLWVEWRDGQPISANALLGD